MACHRIAARDYAERSARYKAHEVGGCIRRSRKAHVEQKGFARLRQHVVELVTPKLIAVGITAYGYEAAEGLRHVVDWSLCAHRGSEPV
jgi:hypothetical protein